MVPRTLRERFLHRPSFTEKLRLQVGGEIETGSVLEDLMICAG